MTGVAFAEVAGHMPSMGASSRWALSPLLAMRHEAFGALLYHGGTRRLTAVRDAGLVRLLTVLQVDSEAGVDLGGALRAAFIPEEDQPGYLGALAGFAMKDVIRPVAAGDTPSALLMSAEPSVSSSCGAPAGMSSRSVVGRAAPPVTRAPLRQPAPVRTIVDECEAGMSAPICLTWEITYGCQLSCRHCLSSSGRRDPRELDTAQCLRLIDEVRAIGVFYINVGGGEPTLRADFWDILDHAVSSRIGVKFSTNGHGMTPLRAAELAGTPYVDVQVSLDGADQAVNDAIRGPGSYRLATDALARLSEAGFQQPKLSVVVTRYNITQLDEFAELADRFSATLRLTRLRPSGRGVDSWEDLHPTRDQLRDLHSWLLEHGESVLTGDSFFHLSAFGAALPGMNVCGAGRVVCLIDPVGDVYACPFAIDETFLAGSVLDQGGFTRVWLESPTFTKMRRPAHAAGCSGCEHQSVCRAGCPAAKHFTGLPADGPDPECVTGRADAALAALAGRDRAALPVVRVDHSHPAARQLPHRPPVHPCVDNPLATASHTRAAR